MFKIDNEKSIHISRGDSFSLNLTANNGNYNFVVGDVIKLRVYEKKGYAKEPVLEVSYTVEVAGINQTIAVPQILFGEDINKPKTYWYEISVNEDSTIIAYDEDGAKLFIVYPADETPAINAPNYSGSLDGTIYPRGGQGIGVKSIEQTTTSEEDSGTNEVTVTLTNGETSTFKVKNGSKGSKGDIGPQGDKGEKGDNNILSIGTVESGVEASATIIGESPSQILNLVLPKGGKGEKGDKGESGVSPTISTNKVGKVTTVTVTDINGTQIFELNDGIDGTGSGDMQASVYDINGNGVVDNAEKVNNHTVESDVPKNAKFTDTTYTNVSEFANDAGYLTKHQDISGKENTSNKVTSISSSSTDTQYPSAKAVYDLFNSIVNGDEVSY